MISYRLNKIWNYIINTFCFYRKKNPILISASVIVKEGRCTNYNWGDDLNIHFLSYITEEPVIPVNKSYYHVGNHQTVYSCIGSILGWFETPKTEIWGSGFIDGSQNLKAIPKKIHSVRGPLTRDRLIELGYSCPEKYGDPALLLSLFYKSNVVNRYRLGVVPHFIDLNIPFITEFCKNNKDVLFIDMTNYENWTDIVDKICSCDMIISSSLHGLIVSDSYKIPNVWVSFSNNLMGGSFKFIDYFKSVKRSDTEPIFISGSEDIEKIKSFEMKTAAVIDYKTIIDSCPFKNKIKLKYEL